MQPVCPSTDKFDELIPGLSIPRLESKARVLISGVNNVKVESLGNARFSYSSTVASSNGYDRYHVSGIFNSNTKRHESRNCSCPVGCGCKHCDATCHVISQMKSDVSSRSQHLDFLYCIQEAISEHLFKKGGIELELYKLNVYSTGGHFNSHVDTPTEPTRFLGTI